jgi:SAM-dependent methyltransferase
MAQYDRFAQFYDAVNGEPEERISQILAYIDEFRPDASSILELGCGTGAVLAGLGSGFSLTGIDLSPEMLEYARRRCPTARLVRDDITTFSLDGTYDAVICVYDTLNHVTTFEGWKAVFARVAAHLAPGGLFIFDLNTWGRLRDLSDAAPWVFDFDGHTLIMSVDFSEEPLSYWDIRIFEHRHDRNFELHHESITELAVPLDAVREALSSDFSILAESDTLGGRPTDGSTRALFVASRSAH